MHDYMTNWGMHGTGWILWIIITGLVIWLIYSYIRKNRNERSDSPLDILKKRLARGEITRKEYEEKKGML